MPQFDCPMLIFDDVVSEDVQRNDTEYPTDHYNISPQEATINQDAQTIVTVTTSMQNATTGYHDTGYVSGVIHCTGPIHHDTYSGSEVGNSCQDIGPTEPQIGLEFNANLLENQATTELHPLDPLSVLFNLSDSLLVGGVQDFNQPLRPQNGEHINAFLEDQSVDADNCGHVAMCPRYADGIETQLDAVLHPFIYLSELSHLNDFSSAGMET